MKLSMFDKIWKDSVWSKVIAVGIIGLITTLYLRIESYSEEITFKEAYKGPLLKLENPSLYWGFLFLGVR